MNVINISSKIGRWSQSNDITAGHMMEGDKPKFLLMPSHPIHKSLFKIENNIYITNIETDFILDINVTTVIQFDVDTDTPKAHDLYEAYLKTKENEELEIERSAELGDIWFRLKVAGTRKPYSRPFSSIENELTQVIKLTYPLN